MLRLSGPCVAAVNDITALHLLHSIISVQFVQTVMSFAGEPAEYAAVTQALPQLQQLELDQVYLHNQEAATNFETFMSSLGQLLGVSLSYTGVAAAATTSIARVIGGMRSVQLTGDDWGNSAIQTLLETILSQPSCVITVLELRDVLVEDASPEVCNLLGSMTVQCAEMHTLTLQGQAWSDACLAAVVRPLQQVVQTCISGFSMDAAQAGVLAPSQLSRLSLVSTGLGAAALRALADVAPEKTSTRRIQQAAGPMSVSKLNRDAVLAVGHCAFARAPPSTTALSEPCLRSDAPLDRAALGYCWPLEYVDFSSSVWTSDAIDVDDAASGISTFFARNPVQHMFCRACTWHASMFQALWRGIAASKSLRTVQFQLQDGAIDHTTPLSSPLAYACTPTGLCSVLRTIALDLHTEPNSPSLQAVSPLPERTAAELVALFMDGLPVHSLRLGALFRTPSSAGRLWHGLASARFLRSISVRWCDFLMMRTSQMITPLRGTLTGTTTLQHLDLACSCRNNCLGDLLRGMNMNPSLPLESFVIGSTYQFETQSPSELYLQRKDALLASRQRDAEVWTAECDAMGVKAALQADGLDLDTAADPVWFTEVSGPSVGVGHGLWRTGEASDDVDAMEWGRYPYSCRRLTFGPPSTTHRTDSPRWGHLRVRGPAPSVEA